MVHDHDLAARPHDAPHLVEDPRWLRHDAHDVGGERDVETAIGEFERASVHRRQRLHMPEGVAPHALSRDLQHRRAEIDAGDARGFWQEPEFEAGADAEYFSVRARRLAGRARGGEPTRAERQVEDEVIDRRPTAIGGVRLVLKPDPGACCARSRHDGDPSSPRKRNDLRQNSSTTGFPGDNRLSRRFWQANPATNARNAYLVRFSASSSRIAADPGFNGFGWLSCGTQPLSHKISNVARKRPSGSANRSAYTAAARPSTSRRSGVRGRALSALVAPNARRSRMRPPRSP